MSAAVKVVEPIPYQQLDQSKFILGKKELNSWNFVDKKTNKRRTGSQTYCNVYYEKPGQKLLFLLEDCKSFSGIQTGDNMKRGFMSLNLKKEISEAVRKAVDTPLFNLAFVNRKEFMKNGAKIKEPAEMRIIFDGVVVDGKPKSEGSSEYWDDCLTANVPLKRKNQQPVLDDNICTIEDLDGVAYAWTALDGKKLKEVAIEIEKMTFDDKKIRVHCLYRLIVPEEKSAPKVLTKRRLAQRDAPADPAPGDAPAQNDAPAPAPSAPSSDEPAAKRARPDAK